MPRPPKKRFEKTWKPCGLCKGSKAFRNEPCYYCQGKGGHWGKEQLFLAIGGPSAGKHIVETEGYLRYNVSAMRGEDWQLYMAAPRCVLVHLSLLQGV